MWLAICPSACLVTETKSADKARRDSPQSQIPRQNVLTFDFLCSWRNIAITLIVPVFGEQTAQACANA